MNARQREFERRRLDRFADHGLTMKPGRLEDRRGRSTYVLDSEGDGRPLLMVHGGGAEGSIWAPIAARFAESHRILVLDRPGCGLSFSVQYGDRDYRDAAAEWYADVVDGLDLERFDVLANSMGGFFSLAYALSSEHDDRIRRLAFAGAPAGLDRWVPLPIRLLGLKGLNRLLFALQGTPEVDDVRELYDQLLVVDADDLEESYLEVGAMSQTLPGAMVGWRTLLEEFTTLRGVRSRYMLRDETASLPIPTLFVWGDEDAFAPPESGENLAERMPDARVARIPNAGHCPWFDAPHRTVDAIAEFLETSATRDPNVEIETSTSARSPQR